MRDTVLKIIAITFWLCSFTASAIVAQDVSEGDPIIFDKRLSQWEKLLTDPSHVVRYRAARDLGHIGSPANAAVPALFEARKDESASVRKYALAAIGRIGPRVKHVPALIEALDDEDFGVRRAAAYVLGDIGPEAQAALPVLKRHKGVEFAYANFQITEGDETAMSYLIGAMKHPDVNTRPREWAIKALGRIGPRAKAALPALRAALRSEDNDIYHRMEAAYAISLVDPDDQAALNFLIAIVESDQYGAIGTAVYLISQMGAAAKPALPSLVKRLRGKETDLFHGSILRALGEIGPTAEAALPTLQEFTTHERASLRKAAALAIYKTKRA